MSTDVTDLVVCPLCHGALEAVRCSVCGTEYRTEQGALDLTPVPFPDDIADKAPVWEAVQANGDFSYRAEPDFNLAVGTRYEAVRFGKFARLRGTVLDIGCGPQHFPSYARDFSGRLVGLDPLIGVQPRGFGFVKGLAEYLPFADGTFDAVLFATSLDHLLSPSRGVREAARVVRPGGEVVFWLDDEGSAPPLTRWWRTTADLVRGRNFATLGRLAASKVGFRRLSPYAHAEQLQVPEGAVDLYHLVKLERDEVDRWIGDAGLRQVEEVHDPSGSLFLRSVPA